MDKKLQKRILSNRYKIIEEDIRNYLESHSPTSGRKALHGSKVLQMSYNTSKEPKVLEERAVILKEFDDFCELLVEQYQQDGDIERLNIDLYSKVAELKEQWKQYFPAIGYWDMKAVELEVIERLTDIEKAKLAAFPHIKKRYINRFLYTQPVGSCESLVLEDGETFNNIPEIVERFKPYFPRINRNNWKKIVRGNYNILESKGKYIVQSSWNEEI